MNILAIALISSLLLSPTLPDTPAGRQFAEWLRVFAAGNQEGFRRFVAERYAKTLLDESPPTDRADRVGRTFMDARSFSIRSIEKSTPEEIVVVAQASLTDLWFRLSMKVEAEAPHRITAYTSQRIEPPSAKKLNERELVSEIAAFVEKATGVDAFSGTILVAKDGRTIYKTARGWASQRYRTPNRIDTKLNLASIGKTFTAVSIAQLAEQGKLSFTDPVGKYLPDYPNKDVREKITLHHLLSHTSGLGELYSPKYECLKGSLREVRDYFPLFADDPKPLSFEPGARWQYSNIGFILLGAIVEKVSGTNYYEYVRKHVFAPAGMSNTDYFESDADTPNLATGYTNFIDLGENNYEFRLGERRNTWPRLTIRGNPQGGAYSTAEDLLRYTLALTGHKLVSAAMFNLMTASKVEARKFDSGQTLWGYGFELENVNGQRVMGHGGGDFGISSAVRMYPDSGNYTVIVLSNYDRGGQIAIFKIQELILFGKS